MKGRFSVKSADGFWLQIAPDGSDWYMTDPRPIRPSKNCEGCKGATSFFGVQPAEAAMERFGLWKADDPRHFATKTPRPAWEVVPDPNP